MLRSVLLLLLLPACCAASATETAACDPTSGDTCTRPDSDTQSVLQNRMQYDVDAPADELAEALADEEAKTADPVAMAEDDVDAKQEEEIAPADELAEAIADEEATIADPLAMAEEKEDDEGGEGEDDEEEETDEDEDEEEDEEDDDDALSAEEEAAVEEETEKQEEPPSDTEEAPAAMAEDEAEEEDDLSGKPRCDKKGDSNCCFTEEGVKLALKKKIVLKGMKAGMCARGGRRLYRKWWPTALAKEWVQECEDKTACTDPNYEALKPGLGKGSESGTCDDYQCPSTYQEKDEPPEGKVCKTAQECNQNCCDVDLNARPNERTEVLSFSTIMVLKNATKISADLDAEKGDPKKEKDHDFGKDMKRLRGAWAGLCKVMKQVKGGKKACPRKKITKMKSCIHKAVCTIEKGIDSKKLKNNKKQLKSYTLLMELYDKFETVAWDKMMGVLRQELGKKKRLKKVDFVSPGELACSGLKKLRAATGVKKPKVKKARSFMEADNEEQEAAYRVSEALVASAETTHAVLDAHTANSSVEETVAALHRAWQVPCEMLDCDHTNYWDLLGASHSHSLALIEAGASAHHMRVHVGVRARLEHRMQDFIGTDGMHFANRIIRTEGTRTEALARAYADTLYEAALELWTEHPKKYGVSSLLLGLVPREELHEQAKTDFQKEAVQAIMDDNFIVASNKATIYKMMEERGLSVSDLDAGEETEEEEEEVPFSLVERSNRLDRTLGRKGVAKFFSSVGKGIVKVGKAVGGAIVSGFVAIGKAVVTVATAIGNVVKAFVDFVLSLFKCFGFGTVGTQGYTKTFPASPAGYFKISLSATVSDAIGGIFQGQVSRSIGIAISLGFVVGATMEIGLSVGVGISAGIACGVNSRTGGSCVFSIGVGITASAAIPDATCIFGASIFGTFKCGKSFGLTLKIMCCNINLVTGCSSCGKGCSDSSTGASNAAATNAVNKRGSGAIQCSENLSGNGAGYRGCQDRTTSGKVCQKWSAQNPHKHTQCRSEYQTMKGKRQRVYCETTADGNKGLGDHNLCRNPDGHSTIWCYTIHKEKRWENCRPRSTSPPRRRRDRRRRDRRRRRRRRRHRRRRRRR